MVKARDCGGGSVGRVSCARMRTQVQILSLWEPDTAMCICNSSPGGLRQVDLRGLLARHSCRDGELLVCYGERPYLKK